MQFIVATPCQFLLALSDINSRITKYSKSYDFNISTPDTPTGEMRVFITTLDPIVQHSSHTYQRINTDESTIIKCNYCVC